MTVLTIVEVKRVWMEKNLSIAMDSPSLASNPTTNANFMNPTNL